MKIILIFLAVFITALVGAYLVRQNAIFDYTGFDIGFEKAVKKTSSTVQKNAEYKASFAIFTNGILRDFSDSKYHNRSKDVYITADNTNLIIVKKEGITWNNFFKTLPSPMQVSERCLITGTGQEFCTNQTQTLRFYLNGKRNNNLLSEEIKNGNKALISYGNKDETEIQAQLKILE